MQTKEPNHQWRLDSHYLSTNLISVFGVYTKLETLLQYCRSIDDLRYPDHYCAVLFKIVEPVALLSCCQ